VPQIQYSISKIHTVKLIYFLMATSVPT
jgi:hypothetical protein